MLSEYCDISAYLSDKAIGGCRFDFVSTSSKRIASQVLPRKKRPIDLLKRRVRNPIPTRSWQEVCL